MNRAACTESLSNRWFATRRDFFTRQMVEDFFILTRSFQDAYQLYLECCDPGTWTCSALVDQRTGEKRARIGDQLACMVGTESRKGPLWCLKDLCHLLWPEMENEQNVSGSLFDWLIGSIFHETMKLKENMYLLNRYGPAAWKLETKPLERKPSPRHGVTPVPKLERIIDMHGLISRAADDAVKQMEQTAFLFSHALYMLRVMLPELAGNRLLIRFLIEREEQVAPLWGEGLEDIFQDMFSGDAAEGFCTAGRSYLGAQWFTHALAMYRRALTVDPTCDEAITRTVQLQEVVRENRELLGAA